MSKDKVSGTLNSWFRLLFWAKLSINKRLKHPIYPINLTKITFETVLRKKYVRPILKGGPMTSFWSPKCPKFDHFHQKWPILTKFTPLMTCLTTFLSINLIEIIFRNFKGENYFNTFPKFVIWRNFGPQNDPILTIFTKNYPFWPN